MKSRLMRVDAEPDVFAPLIEAVRAAGMRCGWLDLSRPCEPPAALEAAARLDVLRAVAVGDGRVISVKPLKGSFVLRDLLREHFRGCDLVLVRGEVEAPRLVSDDSASWKVGAGDGAEERLSTEELVANLRKPRWPEA